MAVAPLDMAAARQPLTSRARRVLQVTGMKLLGIVLVVIGLIGIAWGGLSWTRQRTVLDAGPIEIKADRRESIPIPPIAGAVCLVAGLAMMASDRRRV